MHCKRNRSHRVKKKGYFSKTTGRKRYIQRYYCFECTRSFSERTSSIFRGERKCHVNQRLFRLLNSSMSQRRAAIELNLHRTTVARKIRRFGMLARQRLAAKRDKEFKNTTTIVFDEMETFEHTRCKPLSITLAVDKSTRKIVLARVSSMPPKGHLAKISFKKYGPRKDRRGPAIDRVLRTAKRFAPHVTTLRSDKCPRYPHAVKKHFPEALHDASKSRRAATVGLGEMKVGGWDPLFSLNHTAAMNRDNLKRLTRKTWCTTKRQSCLQDMVDMYTWFHNEVCEKGWHRVRI